MMWLIDMAYAMGQRGGQEGAKGGGDFGGIIMLLAIFAIFYFILIRPQQKKAKEHQELIKNLKKGDEVITSGGIHGKITGLTDNIVILEVADKVRIKVSRNNIASLKKTEGSK